MSREVAKKRIALPPVQPVPPERHLKCPYLPVLDLRGRLAQLV